MDLTVLDNFLSPLFATAFAFFEEDTGLCGFPMGVGAVGGQETFPLVPGGLDWFASAGVSGLRHSRRRPQPRGQDGRDASKCVEMVSGRETR